MLNLRALYCVLVSAVLTCCQLAPSAAPPTHTTVPAPISPPPATTPAPIQTLSDRPTLIKTGSGDGPISGSVVWEEGRCCAGGTAGETIQVRAGFATNSPMAEGTQMRVRAGGFCFPEVELAQSAWEPFVLEKSYPFTLPINWVGFYISVQYRDLDGNLSPVYCDDISLEGMPSRTP